MSKSDLKNQLLSLAIGSAILFGAGYNPTLDAIMATAIWAMLIFVAVVLVIFSVVFIALGLADIDEFLVEENAKPFYEAILKMHSRPVARIVSFILTCYWLYAFVVHEWTATAVFYVIVVLMGYFFIFLTKELAVKLREHFEKEAA